jgi:acyl carrier protein
MKEQIREIMRNILGIEEITDNISQATCDTWDSLRHFSLIVELELLFSISLEPEEITQMQSLEAIHAILSEKIEH